MKMTGEFRLHAQPSKVWDALNDPEVLRQSIPGCESLEKISNTELKAIVKAKVGPVSASFKGAVTLSDLDPPNGYRISGEGSGGAAGFAKGGAIVRLQPDGTGTLLSYDVDATVGGKLAQIGQRLIDGTAKKMADDFFANFAAAVDSPSAEPRPGKSAPAEDADAPQSPSSSSSSPPLSSSPSRTISSRVWFAGLTVAVLIVLAYFLAR